MKLTAPDERYFALARQIWDRINARDFSVTDLAEALSDLRVQLMGHPQNQTHPTCKDCHDAGVNAARAAVYDYAGPTSPWHMDLMRRIDSALLGEHTEQEKCSRCGAQKPIVVNQLCAECNAQDGPWAVEGARQPPSDALHAACEELAVFGDYCGDWICKLCKAKTPGEPPAGYARKPFPHRESCVLHRTANLLPNPLPPYEILLRGIYDCDVGRPDSDLIAVRFEGERDLRIVPRSAIVRQTAVEAEKVGDR